MAIELKLGLYALHRGDDPDAMARQARAAEEAGFESLWVGDHPAMPVEAGPVNRLEALTTLTFLAAATSRVKLAVGVIVVPQRQPVLLAKQLATIDVLSKGRLIVGVGVGHLEAELRAFGAPLERRGPRTDEYVQAMLALWDEPVPRVDGEFVSVSGVMQRPRPVQRPHPPIVVGGMTAAAHRRAARLGDGWFGWNLDVEETAEALEALKKHERPEHLGELEITITPPGAVDRDTARRYADIGVHRLALACAAEEVDALISDVSENLIGRL